MRSNEVNSNRFNIFCMILDLFSQVNFLLDIKVIILFLTYYQITGVPPQIKF